MRAIRVREFGGPEVMRLEDIPPPVPRPGEVLIRVSAAGVNYADLKQREGTYPLPVRLPLTLGLEVAGTVAGLGEGVQGLAEGMRVIAPTRGGYAEYALARAANVVLLPDALEYGAATSLLIQGSTALLMLRAARLKAGESVLVHAAAGGVGLLAVQLAKNLGATPIIGTASSAPKLELAKAFGAQVGIDYTQPGWVDEVKQATGGKGADLVLEMAGGEIGARSLSCLAPFGRMVVFGVASGKAAPIDPLALIFHNQSVLGFALTGLPAQQVSGAVRDLVGEVSQGRLKLAVGQTFSLEQAAQAHAAMGQRQTTGKIVLSI